MKYFVTGATGFVGGKVAQQLSAQGHQVLALARDLSRASALSAQGITVVQGNITDKDSMREPMRGADGVFHIAGWYQIGTRDKHSGQAINIDGTRNVLQLMQELGIARGVYTSTLAVNSDTHGLLRDETYRYEGPHVSEYDRTKWEAHYQVAEPMIAAGLPLIVVQPGLVYGPGDNGPMHDTLIQYMQGRLPIVPQKVAYCWGHVDDIAQGHLLAMEKGKVGESYNICGPVATLIDALALAEKTTGIPAPRIHPGPGLLKAAARVMAVIEKIIPMPVLYSSETLRVTAGVTYLGNNEKAKRELGFTARSLEEGLPPVLLADMKQLGLTPRRG